jgi:hypothetical protein
MGMVDVIVENGLGEWWEGRCGIQRVLFIVELH